MALHLLQTRAELFKLGLDRTQDRPDLAAALLDGQRAEAHLQGVEQRRHGGRPGHRDLVIPLQKLRYTAGNHLGVQPLKRQEQDAEARRVGHLNVLVVDVPGLGAQDIVQRLAHGGHSGSIAALLRCLQMRVGIAREFRVDGQPDRAVLPRHLDGILHAVRAAGHGGNVAGVLAGGQDLLQNRAELHLAQDAAGLDAGQHML